MDGRTSSNEGAGLERLAGVGDASAFRQHGDLPHRAGHRCSGHAGPCGYGATGSWITPSSTRSRLRAEMNCLKGVEVYIPRKT